MLRDYRDWLRSELELLGNASHHAYAFGQANMAQRAIAELDTQLARTLYVAIEPGQARAALTDLMLIAQNATSLPPALEALRDALKAALVEAEPPDGEEAPAPR